MVAVARNRVHVFAPKTPTGGAILIDTPIRATELRPSLTKYSQKGSVLEKYEFGAYVRFVDSRPDQWIQIYDGQGEMNDRTKEAFGPWYDYCSDIFDAWSPEDGESKYDQKALDKGAWRLMAAGAKSPS
jgi:hypothetical protein